jgi:hypothetical protein
MPGDLIILHAKDRRLKSFLGQNMHVFTASSPNQAPVEDPDQPFKAIDPVNNLSMINCILFFFFLKTKNIPALDNLVQRGHTLNRR